MRNVLSKIKVIKNYPRGYS